MKASLSIFSIEMCWRAEKATNRATWFKWFLRNAMAARERCKQEIQLDTHAVAISCAQ